VCCLTNGISFAQSTQSNYKLSSNQISSLLSEKLLLVDYLKEIESVFQIYILAESDLLADIEVTKIQISKDKPVEFYLNKILNSTKLEFVKVAATTYVIVLSKKEGFLYGKILDDDNNPLTGATIYNEENEVGVITDLDGFYEFKLPPGKHELEIRYVGYKSQKIEIDIYPDNTLEKNIKLLNYPQLKEIVVVGSRFSEVSLLEKTAPTELIKAEDFSNIGQTEITNLLHYAVPSFHSTPQTISDGTDHINPATLRGLGPDQLLVLINGKRRHHSALVNINGTIGRGSVATDLNTIPAAAIEKIEVLRDGAATIYGSDAIAGVINIVLKENTNFTDINVLSGLTKEGDGRNCQVNGNYGTKLGDKGGFLNLSFDFLHREGVNRSGNYTGKIFGDSRDENQTYIDEFFAQTGFDNQRVMSIGSANNMNASMFLNAAFPIGEKTTIYATGGTSYRLGSSTGFYRFPYQTYRQSGLFPMGFSPELNTNIFDQSLTVGVRTEKLPVQIDFSNTIGGNKFDFDVENSNNASMGLLSPTQVYAGGFSYNQNVTNLDISKKIDGEIPVFLGFGSEFRLENFHQKAGDESSYMDGGMLDENGNPREIGFQLFPGFRPENVVNVYRHNLGAYSNVEIKLVPALQMNAALRYEYYSDFGSNLSWRVGSRYTINDKVSIRSTYNTGFRAPSMPQAYFSSLGFQFISEGGEQKGIKVAHFNNQSSVSNEFGIASLKAETSSNFSFGVAAQILKNLSFTFDTYQIDIKDRIVITGRFSTEDDARFEEILASRGISKAQFFTNAIDTKTTGVDLKLNYKFQFQNASLHLSAASNFNKTTLVRDGNGNPIIHTSSYLDGYQDILFNREEISRIEVAQPNSKSIFRAIFKMKKLEWMLAAVNFGKVQYIHPEDGESANWVLNELTGAIESRDQVFLPKWTTDLSIKYNLNNRIALLFGGNNIFDVYPDKHTHSANISNGLFQYSRRVQQFGVSGAYWYGRLNFKL